MKSYLDGRRSRAHRWLLLGLLLAPMAVPLAATFPDLYTVTVAAEPGVERAEVERMAMTRILTRVTGSRDAALDPALQPLIQGATQYVDSWAIDRERRFRVGFNASAVARALGAINQPVWGQERPLTLLWIAIDAGLGERALLGGGDPGDEWSPEMSEAMRSVREQLLDVADARGVPVTFPLLDLEDIGAVSFGDVWGGFHDRVERASRRYGADAILIGRLRESDFGFSVDWTLLQGGERQFVIGSTVSDGLDWAADVYAADLRTVGGTRLARLTVLDVTSLADYGRVMRYLENASLLERVDVEAFEDGVLSLTISARGDAAVLARVLSLGGVLASTTLPGGSPAEDLVFRVAR